MKFERFAFFDKFLKGNHKEVPLKGEKLQKVL